MLYITIENIVLYIERVLYIKACYIERECYRVLYITIENIVLYI